MPALLQVHSRAYDHLAEKKGHEPDRCLPAAQDELVGRGTQGSDVALYKCVQGLQSNAAAEGVAAWSSDNCKDQFFGRRCAGP